MTETNGTAEALAEVVNDGIIDLDAAETPVVEAEAEERPEGEQEEKPEAKTEEVKDEGEDDKPKKPSGAQRNKIREQHLLRELSEAQQKIEELSRSQTPANAGAEDDNPPREEDFKDFFEWQQALTAYRAGKAASEAVAKQFKDREAAERSTKQTEIARERTIAHAERVEDARDVIADFDKVMDGMKGVNVRNDVIEEIMSSDKSALVAYHLAQHPDKLSAMNAMSARELAREVGRLEATLQLPSAKKQTTAPPPLKAVKGGASPSSAEGDLNAWLNKTYGKGA